MAVVRNYKNIPLFPLIMRVSKRSSDLSAVFEKMLWKYEWGAVSDLLIPYAWRKPWWWLSESILLVLLEELPTRSIFPLPVSLSVSSSMDFPPPVPTISPSPILRQERGVNGNALQTSIQRGECAYLSPNTVPKKKSLSLIAFGIYSNDLPRRVLRCQGFFISNISPNRIFVRIC